MGSITLNQIKAKLSGIKPQLYDKYGVEYIGIFGSFVKGTTNGESDIDILVEISKPISLLRFIEMENYLSDLLGAEVDLVMKDSLKPRIGSHILKEVITI